MPISLLSKSTGPFCCSLFFKEYLNPQDWINKIVNGNTVVYHPLPSELTSRIHPLILLWTPKEFISQEYLMSFFLNLNIPPRLRKSFKSVVLRLPENTFMSQNLFILNLFIFNHVFKQNSPPGSYYHIPCWRKLPNAVELHFFWKSIFFKQKGGRIMELKKWPKLSLRRYWLQVLVNSTIFATFTFLVSFLLCHN